MFNLAIHFCILLSQSNQVTFQGIAELPYFLYIFYFFFLDISFTCMGFRVWGRHMEMAFQKMWEAARGGISKPEPCTSLNLGFSWVFLSLQLLQLLQLLRAMWTIGQRHQIGQRSRKKWWLHFRTFFSPKRLIPGVVSRMESWTLKQPLRHQSNIAKCSSKRLFASSEFKRLIFAGGGTIHLLSIAFWSRKTILTWDAEDLSTPQSFKDRTRLEGMAAREEQLGEDAHVSSVALMLQESKTCKGSLGHWCWESKRNVNGRVGFRSPFRLAGWSRGSDVLPRFLIIDFCSWFVGGRFR